MLDIDVANERILKEYIDGPTIYDLVKKDAMKDLYLVQMREMAKVVYEAGLNIDYFPTNFIVQDEKIFYIDYECNNYMDEWNFENWGIKYWSKTTEFIDYMEQHQLCNSRFCSIQISYNPQNLLILHEKNYTIDSTYYQSQSVEQKKIRGSNDENRR